MNPSGKPPADGKSSTIRPFRRRIVQTLVLASAVFGFAPYPPGQLASAQTVALPPAGATQVTRAHPATVLAAHRGAPSISLRDGQAVTSNYLGESFAAQSFRSGRARALAVTTGDFDEDGMPDLAGGYSVPGGGAIAIQRGNVDALWPYGAAIRNGEPPAFLPDVRVFALPEPPDFLGAGDFDADGHWDIVAARRGSNTLYFLRGDGHGGFAEPRAIQLAGGVTALIAGELNRPDGLTDIAVAVTGGKGSQVLVFESPDGALRADPEVIPLTSPATALAVAPLGGHGSFNDLAIAAGHDLLLVHGRDRMLSQTKVVRDAVGPPTITRQSLKFAVTALAAGNFTSTGLDLAALGDDGKIHLLERADAAEQAELAAMPPSIANPRGGETAPHSASGATTGGATTSAARREQLFAQARARNKQLVLRGEVDLPAIRQLAPRLTAAHLSVAGGDDLIVADNSANQLHIVSRNVSRDVGMHLAASLDVAQGGPAAVLPMRLHPSALSDLVVMHAAEPLASVTPQAGTVFTVTNTVDDGTLLVPNYTPGSLRAAIINAGANNGPSTIVFNIPTTDANYNPGTGIFTITPIPNTNCGSPGPIFIPCTGLPILVAGVTVDAYTQPGASPNTLANGDNAVFKIQISGALAHLGPSGFVAFGGADTIRGFVINGFTDIYNPEQKALNGGSGVDVESGGNFVEGNFLGTDYTGSIPMSNSIGVESFASGGNAIGGTTLQARNLVSGNPFAGIGLGATPPPNSFFVRGNFLGTDRSGTLPIFNSGSGVTSSGTNVVTGGTVAGARNIIGATNIGVYLHCPACISNNNLVQGNYIGTDVTGTQSIFNSAGVTIDLGNSNTIGGTSAGAGNIISGNQDGVQVYDGTLLTLIQGNYIGLDATGTHALGNFTGINHTPAGNTYPASTTTIGGESAGAGNVISSNLLNGIEFGGIAVTEGLTSGGYCCQLNPQVNTVLGNFIGTDASGQTAMGNGGAGILFDQGGSYGQVGGTDTHAANVIAFNQGDGVRIDPASNYTRSLVGLGGDLTVGNTIFSNGGAGVHVLSGTGNAINQNLIFSNGQLGIDVGPAGENANSSCNTSATGANNLQNSPVLTPAVGATLISATATDPNGNTSEFSNCAFMATSGGLLNIVGQLNSLANTRYTIEFFQNTSCDASGFGQGKSFLQSISVVTANNCIAVFGDSVNLAAADLGLTFASAPSITLGAPLTFVGVVTNNGPASAANVSVTTTLSATFSLVSATTTQGTCTPSGNTLTCSLGTMPSGATATITVNANTVSIGTQNDTASVSSSTTDSNPANNSATISVAVNYPLSVIDHLTPASVVAGSPNLPLTIIGIGFFSGVTTVTFNGTSLTPTFLGTQACSNGVLACQGLQVTVPAALLATAGTPNVTVTNPAPGGGSNSAVFTIFASVGAVTHFSVTGFPSPATAGVVNSFTVTALDVNGQVVPAYRGTVQFRANVEFSLTAPNGFPVPNYTFVAADNGLHTFQAYLGAAGPNTIDVSDAGTPSVTGSEMVTIQPGPVSRIIDFFDGNGTPVGFPFDPFREVVTDAFSNSLPNVPLTFKILELDGVTPATPSDPGCTFSNGLQTITVNTDSNGQVLVTCTANLIAGEFTVLVTVPGNNITIGGNSYGAAIDIFPTTNNNPPAHLTPYAPVNNQTAQVNTQFRFGVGVIVTDASNNPVPGMTVTYAVNPNANGASATLGQTSAVSERTVDPIPGYAHISPLMANGIVGSYTVTASLGSLTASINLTNSPGPNPVAGISVFSGTPQQTLINTPFAAPLKAYPFDAQGNPLGAVPITFTVPASGASAILSATSVLSPPPDGVVSVTATANGIPGTYNVTVSAGGFSQTFTLTNLPGASNSIAAVGGTPQSTPVSTLFVVPLQVSVIDPNGRPLSGQTVTFSAPAAGATATLSSTTAVSNSAGIASILAVANGTAGAYSVTATLGNLTATFNLTNTVVNPGSVTATSGTPQSAQTGAAFGSQLFATVKDTNGNPMNNVLVTFSAPSSGPSAVLSSTTALTNSLGVANVAATANGTVGSYAVTASVGELSAAFSLTNTAPTNSVTATGGTPQSTAVGTAFATALQATVRDPGGQPVSGVSVTFAMPGSGASATLSSSTATTNASGIATVNATANTVVGSYAVTATVGARSASFALTNTPGAPASITATAGTPQSVLLNTALPTALQATVKDAFGNLLAGVSVTFTAPASGATGAFTGSATVATNAAGVATAPAFTSNGTVGAYQVTATAGSLSATFNLTNVAAAPAFLTVFAGNNQSVTVGTAFGALSAKVTDAGGNPLGNVPVTFTPPGSGPGGGFSASATVNTNSSGIATAPAFTANTTAGAFTVTASTAALSANFALTNLPGAAASIAATAGTPQSAPVNSAFATRFQATVRDIYGNTVPGVSVTFAAPGSGASGAFGAGATQVTNSAGVVTAPVFTANATVGSYNATATAAGVAAPANFSLTNIFNPAAGIQIVSGDGQSANLGTLFNSPLTVKVVDGTGAPAANITVTFTLPAFGNPSVAFQGGPSPLSATAATNALGLATSPALSAGSQDGFFSVVASAPGVSGTLQAVFTLRVTRPDLNFSVSPEVLNFERDLGLAAPAAQLAAVTGPDSGAPFTIDQPWIKATRLPGSGAVAYTLQVTVDSTGLAPGTYLGNITVSPGVALRVVFVIKPLPQIQSGTASLAFQFTVGQAVPPEQLFTVYALTRNVTFTVSPLVTTPSGGSWLKATPSTGTTEISVHVSVAPAGLAAGTYQGTLHITAPDTSNGQVDVPVTLQVNPGPPPPPPPPAITGIVNAASFQGVAASGNEILSLFGTNLACPAGPQILMNGLPVLVLGSTDTQVNWVAPSLTGLTAIQIQFACGGIMSGAFSLSVAAIVPGIFASGGTQVAAYNQGYTLNGPAIPAARGDIVMLFGTGFGLLNAPDANGLQSLVNTVVATIGGLPAEVTFAGAAPGLPGVTQINVRIPQASATGGAVPLTISAGSVVVPTNLTVAVQ